ncbi:unnamed protein product [Onchocerca flexuosa]|uniref:AB hydrolase-1 domain-containing protein n=1 Tax=Onchocerca flexuosa TaxID=387005 RepID=A0A183I4G4_9BILA|nr:unnamed protein product [Onchocerca flexuosa]
MLCNTTQHCLGSIGSFPILSTCMDTYTHSTIRLADFQKPIPERVLWRSKAVRPTEGNFLAGRYEIFFRETVPPREIIYKGTILLIHGQSFSSSTWLENSTMQIFSAAGYRCLAFDMPGCGKTGGPTVPDSEKAEIIPLAMRALKLETMLCLLLRIPSAGHACYLSNPVAFQSACLNFFETTESFVVVPTL